MARLQASKASNHGTASGSGIYSLQNFDPDIKAGAWSYESAMGTLRDLGVGGKRKGETRTRDLDALFTSLTLPMFPNPAIST
jgi:hypothetical protein